MSLLAPRRLTKPVYVGDVRIGGGAPIVVQSMATADTRDPKATLRQISELSKRTNNQAVSLEETASSMEQVLATVRQNADNAHHAEIEDDAVVGPYAVLEAGERVLSGARTGPFYTGSTTT